jgi:hypothetical protein
MSYKEENQLTDRDLHEMYDEMLNDVYGECEVAGMKYETAYVLKDLDPVAYRVGFNDWLDAELTDGNLFQDSKTYEIYSSDEEEEVAA